MSSLPPPAAEDPTTTLQEGSALVLSKCPLFKDFSETGLAILASIGVERTIPAGTPLFVEGMASDAFYVIKSGTVRVALSRDPAEPALGTLGVGQALGQLSLFSGTSTSGNQRLASVTAETDAEVVEIRARDFQRLQTQKPQACLKLLLSVAADLGRNLSENRELMRAMAIAARRT